MRAIYVLDGAQVRALEDFWRLIGDAVNGPGGYFGKSLDAFADCFSGGFGQPDDDDSRRPARRGTESQTSVRSSRPMSFSTVTELTPRGRYGGTEVA